MNRLKHTWGGISAALSLALILSTSAIGFLACTSDKTPVETSVGVRPAGEVKSIDTVADVLAQLVTIQNAAVKKHDAKFGQEPAAVHSERSQLLTSTGRGLKASIRLLGQIKKGEVASGPMAAFVPIQTLARPFLDIAIALGVVSVETANSIRLFLPPEPPPGTAWRLIKTGAGTYVQVVRVTPTGIVVVERK